MPSRQYSRHTCAWLSDHVAGATESPGKRATGQEGRDRSDRDGALLERLEPIDAFDQRRLARARWTAHHDDFALGDFRRAMLQHLLTLLSVISADDRDPPLQPAHQQRSHE